MSSKLVVDMWHSPYGDASTILVLMALADEANDKGECTAVDIDTVSGKARQSVRNCRYTIRRLEEVGIIERFEARGRGHKNSYRIHIENMEKLQPLQVLNVKTTQNANKDTTSTENLQTLQVSENLQKVQPLPISENLQNLQKVQGVQVLEQEKPANAATTAPLAHPPSPDPFPLEQTKDLGKTQTPHPLTPSTGNGVCVSEPEVVDTTAAAFQPYTQGFRDFCAAYPQHKLIGQSEAWSIWLHMGLEARASELLAKIEWHKHNTWANTEPRWIPQINTWFEKSRYNDAIPANQKPEKPRSNRAYT